MGPSEEPWGTPCLLDVFINFTFFSQCSNIEGVCPLSCESAVSTSSVTKHQRRCYKT